MRSNSFRPGIHLIIQLPCQIILQSKNTRVFNWRSLRFSRIENVLSEHGVKFLQTFNVQRIPSSQGITNKRLVHGSTSERALTYMVRNVHFEPSENPSIDYVSRSMKEISSAFFWKRPAIISSHRVNYIGAINEKNRKRGLTDLQDLLQRIVKTWPDVQFISSEQLAHRMK